MHWIQPKPVCKIYMYFNQISGGHGDRVITLSPPTSEIGVRFPARPQVGKLLVACRWSAVYSTFIYLYIYLGFYVAFNTVQVISRLVVGRAEETSTYSSSGFCTVNCQPTASNYQLSHLRLCREPNPGHRGGRRECYHSATVVPQFTVQNLDQMYVLVTSALPTTHHDMTCTVLKVM